MSYKIKHLKVFGMQAFETSAICVVPCGGPQNIWTFVWYTAGCLQRRWSRCLAFLFVDIWWFELWTFEHWTIWTFVQSLNERGWRSRCLASLFPDSKARSLEARPRGWRELCPGMLSNRTSSIFWNKLILWSEKKSVVLRRRRKAASERNDDWGNPEVDRQSRRF